MKLDATEFIEGLDILKHLHNKLTPDVIVREVIGYPCYLKDIMGPPADDPPPPPLLSNDDELLTIDIFLGTYNSANRSIKLFSENIQKAARLLDCEEEDLEYVVRFHEHAHALIHLGVTEADRWEGLKNGRIAASRLKRLTTIYNQIDPFLHEHLAQLVTYQVLKKLSEDSEDHIVYKAAGRMLDIFNNLMRRQPRAYRVEPYLEVPLERLRGTIRLIKKEELAGKVEPWREIMSWK